MKPSLSAIRSIAVDFALRLYFPVVITFAVAAVVLLAVSIWLVTVSLWWLILLVVVVMLTIIAAVLLVLALVVIKTVDPGRTKIQKEHTKAFVDKLLRVAEVTGTPKVWLLFQAIKDIIMPSQKGFIASVSHDTVSLSSDFIALKDTFN